MHNYFELFHENRGFGILYPPFTPFNEFDLKSKKEEAAQVAMQTLQKCDCSAVKLFCETGIFIVNPRSVIPLVPDSCLHRRKWRLQALGCILNLRVYILWYLLWITCEEIQKKKWIKQSKTFWISSVQNLKLRVIGIMGEFTCIQNVCWSLSSHLSFQNKNKELQYGVRQSASVKLYICVFSGCRRNY